LAAIKELRDVPIDDSRNKSALSELKAEGDKVCPTTTEFIALISLALEMLTKLKYVVQSSVSVIAPITEEEIPKKLLTLLFVPYSIKECCIVKSGPTVARKKLSDDEYRKLSARGEPLPLGSPYTTRSDGIAIRSRHPVFAL
jgi:hypothetical protein